MSVQKAWTLSVYSSQNYRLIYRYSIKHFYVSTISAMDIYDRKKHFNSNINHSCRCPFYVNAYIYFPFSFHDDLMESLICLWWFRHYRQCRRNNFSNHSPTNLVRFCIKWCFWYHFTFLQLPVCCTFHYKKMEDVFCSTKSTDCTTVKWKSRIIVRSPK